jgi:hypothetical protein
MNRFLYEAGVGAPMFDSWKTRGYHSNGTSGGEPSGRQAYGSVLLEGGVCAVTPDR